jgi:hypothetical protein
MNKMLGRWVALARPATRLEAANKKLDFIMNVLIMNVLIRKCFDKEMF